MGTFLLCTNFNWKSNKSRTFGDDMIVEMMCFVLKIQDEIKNISLCKWNQ